MHSKEEINISNKKICERRWHPLLEEWVIVASATSNRPWSGATLEVAKSPGNAITSSQSDYDEMCYLCPGNTRSSGQKNPNYQDVYIFDNDHASFSLSATLTEQDREHQYFEKKEKAIGICKVVCFSAKHNLTLAEMENSDIQKVIEAWQNSMIELKKNLEIDAVLIFENKGKCIGVSNLHPHGQLYATGFIPKITHKQACAQAAYHKKHGSSLMIDLLNYELKNKNRIVLQNEYFVAFIPFFARFAYELYLVPRRFVNFISDLTQEETAALTEIYLQLLIRFDNLYHMSFPNITTLHNAPVSNKTHLYEVASYQTYCFHMQFYPPLRDADKLKYLAGFESGAGNIINPVDPVVAAHRLRAASTIHYKKNNQ